MIHELTYCFRNRVLQRLTCPVHIGEPGVILTLDYWCLPGDTFREGDTVQVFTVNFERDRGIHDVFSFVFIQQLIITVVMFLWYQKTGVNYTVTTGFTRDLYHILFELNMFYLSNIGNPRPDCVYLR